MLEFSPAGKAARHGGPVLPAGRPVHAAFSEATAVARAGVVFSCRCSAC